MNAETLLSQKKFIKNDHNISSRLLSLDLYGKPVSLTFQGQDKIKTPFGATITILLSLFLFIFGIHRWFSTLSNTVSYVPLHRSNLITRRESDPKIDAAFMFAFGLGDTHVHKSVGEFKLVRLNESKEVVHQYQIVRCELDYLCRESFANDNHEALYYASRIDQEDLELDLETDLHLSF